MGSFTHAYEAVEAGASSKKPANNPLNTIQRGPSDPQWRYIGCLGDWDVWGQLSIRGGLSVSWLLCLPIRGGLQASVRPCAIFLADAQYEKAISMQDPLSINHKKWLYYPKAVISLDL